MARKTFKVEDLVTAVNHNLRNGIDTADTRYGMIALIEQVLHDSGNYKGYRYLTQAEIPSLFKPGIHTDANGDILPYPDRFKDIDDSRREYRI